jgi:hypothetical protein
MDNTVTTDTISTDTVNTDAANVNAADICNIRDKKTKASVLPQYNIINIMYRLYVQIFKRISQKQYPPYVQQFIEANLITSERILSQQQLIADLFDGLLKGEYERSPDMNYLHKAMTDCRWKERFDWAAMGVFDMLTSQSLLATWFLTIADLYSEADVQAQNPGELRELIDKQCHLAVEGADKLLNG